jgi:F-type H+-transporting ATPase subunit epsilon
MWYRRGQERIYLALANGFAEVLPDRVTILAQLAERAEDIDVARAEEAKRRAEARLVQAKDIDYERARTALMKSLARLQVASRAQFAGRIGRQRMPPPQA